MVSIEMKRVRQTICDFMIDVGYWHNKIFNTNT